MNKLKFVLLVALVIVSGCSITNTMNGIMSSWVGANIDEVVAQWGYPHEQREFRGRTLYVWNRNTTLTMPQTTNTTANVYGNTVYAQSTTTGGNTTHWSCQRILEVNENGTVISYQWGGNNCPFGEIMQYSNWRKKTTQE
ncbi:MAG: hypothetical protein COB26_10970 [Piscirickettsiaceae bacterium]|nr:MAG: hypothetical protein COB26_10970 [Piscirickettsiaceae bacterium]